MEPTVLGMLAPLLLAGAVWGMRKAKTRAAEQRVVRWGLLSVWVLVRAMPSSASTGMPGLDTLYTNVDEGIGSTGYMLFLVAVLGILGTLWSGHYYAGFGLFVVTALGAGFVGYRAEWAGIVNLTLGADLTTLPLIPLDGLP